MRIITYTIYPDEVADEILWLKGMKIYPSQTRTWVWKNLPTTNDIEEKIKIGMIVNDEQLLTIKLRRELYSDSPYKK